MSFVDYSIQKTEDIGRFVSYISNIGKQVIKPPFRWREILQQLEFVGHQSLNIILLTAFFTGAVFALQIGGIFSIFRAEGMMGGATGKALATELAPLVTGFLMTGRVGSAMTSELATMKVNEQIDAMEAMGVDPIHYLVVPRVLACLLMIPFLCGVFMFLGVVGAWATGTLLFHVDQGVFMEKLKTLVHVSDVWLGLRKSVCFAVLIGAVACRFGLNASGGAKGVGLATTTGVVNTLLMILCTDFLISYIQVRWFG
ncbi:MAG: MlaE family ABC transporter permease [Oligoflexales bacterium]